MKAKQNQEFPKKWTGVVEIKTGETAAKLTSIDTIAKTGKIKTFPDDSMSIKIKLADFPKAALRVIKPNMEAKRFRVRLNEDADGVENVTPVSGMYPGKLTGLGPKTKDGEFKLIKKTFNEGTEKENSHLEFIALYEITEGPFRGVETPGYYLHYKFEEDEEDAGFTQFNTADTPQASQLHKLQAWAATHGDILDAPVRWHDVDDGTILPELEERALDADRPVNLIFERGYINLVQPLEDYGTDEDEDDEPDFLKEPEVVEEEVVPVKIKKSAQVNGKIKKAPAKKVKVSEDDDL